MLAHCFAICGGGASPLAPTRRFSVIICDGNQTINNYSGENTVTTWVGAPRGRSPRGQRAERAIGVVGGATPSATPPAIISYIIPWTPSHFRVTISFIIGSYCLCFVLCFFIICSFKVPYGVDQKNLNCRVNAFLIHQH